MASKKIRVKNKIIVITGATRGIGLALKNKLSATNTVVTLSRSETPNGSTAFCADVSKREEVEKVFKEIGRIYGNIDILINNAGYGLSGATELLSEDKIRQIVDTNYLGAIWCCQCALPFMKSGAKIANISSASGVCPMPYRAMYNSTKAGLTSFSNSLNIELRHLGIACTAFILGSINTKFASNRVVVSTDDSRYSKQVSTVDNWVANQKQSTKMDVDKLAGSIVRILGKKRLRLNYIVGIQYKLANLVAKVFPQAAIYCTAKVMSRTKK